MTREGDGALRLASRLCLSLYIGAENDAALKSLNVIQTIYLGRGGMEGPDRRNVDERSGPCLLKHFSHKPVVRRQA
jgi:hypothetical protein